MWSSKTVVFARLVEVSQLVVGMEGGGGADCWPTAVWFGVNVIHHQRKDTSHKNLLQAWPDFPSLSSAGRRVRVSLGLGPFFFFGFMLLPSGQPSQCWVFKQASKRLTDKPQTGSQIGVKETLTWILR